MRGDFKLKQLRLQIEDDITIYEPFMKWRENTPAR
jgi:hypothetical protein